MEGMGRMPGPRTVPRTSASWPLRVPLLCLVTDRTACLGRPLENVVIEAVRAGVGMVQLREKNLPAMELLDLGKRLLGPVRAAGALLVVNDRIDVALALGADGVQLGRGSLPVREARRLLGDSALVGVSAHSLEEVVDAEAAGADYAVLGTIFETRSHPGSAGAGPVLVAEVTFSARIPIIAIGGITPANAGSVMSAGAAGVAVITAIQSASDVEAATRSLLQAMGAGTADYADGHR